MRQRIFACLRPSAWWWLAAILAAEFIAFDQFGARRHTSLYPRWHDQIQYLGESYQAYEFARARGVLSGLMNALTNVSAQGSLHDFFALLVFIVAGPSRSAALAVNMLALITWQIVLFAATRRFSGSRALALAAAMLPLALAGPWRNIPGSAYDFRLDHLAMCALGVTAAIGSLADGFNSRRASTWFGAAVGMTVLTRFITGTYFVLIMAGLAVWLGFLASRRTRFPNLLRAALIAFAITVPFLWVNFEALRDYYWVGHYVGPESVIRNPRLSLPESFGFVVRQAAERHVGPFFGVLAATGVVLFGFFRQGGTGERPALEHTRAGPLPESPSSFPASPWVLGILFMASPLVILTLHVQKSEVVVGALVPGFVMVVIAAWVALARRCAPIVTRVFAAAVVFVTLGTFIRWQLTPAYPPEVETDIRQVNTMADRIFTRATAAGLTRPRVGVDHITDALDAQVLRVITYERKHEWVSYEMLLPTSIAEPADAEVRERLAQCDFVFITDDGPGGGFPFDQKLASMRSELRAWCERNLRPAESFTLLGRRMTLYQRPEIRFP